MTLFLRFVGCLATLLALGSVFSLRADDTSGGVQPPHTVQSGLTLRDQAASNTDSTETVTFTSSDSAQGDLSDHLLVVYNANDPDSKNLAEYYAAKRSIPDDRIFALSCPVTEEITRDQFDDTVRRPILGYLMDKNWMTRQQTQVQFGARTLQLLVANHNDIWAILLMRGVPLKIAPSPDSDGNMEDIPELETNAAAIDSELALLPVFGLPLGGFVPNQFFDFKGIGACKAGPDMAKKMILVTRLDGPTPDDVRRMIDDSLSAEKNRLAGLAVIDTRGIMDPKDAYILGDIWLRNSREMLVRDGWTVKFDDKSDVLPPTDPCNQVAFYLGWYASDATGPWITPPDRFVPGAIAYHLHSYSASTVRSATSNWVGPLIAHGAAATMGTVYEPSLGLTPYLDIFTKRILAGDSFAEAAYASIRGLSWMTTVVGDPLYRPFRQPLAAALADAKFPHTEHDDWLLLQQLQRELIEGKLEKSEAAIEQRLDVPGASAVADEGLGDLLQKLHDPLAEAAIEKAYRKALVDYTAPIDQIRVGLKLSQYYVNSDEDSSAREELHTLRTLYPDEAIRFGANQPLLPAPVPSLPASLPTATAHDSNPAQLASPPQPPHAPLPPMPQQQPSPE